MHRRNLIIGIIIGLIIVVTALWRVNDKPSIMNGVFRGEESGEYALSLPSSAGIAFDAAEGTSQKVSMTDGDRMIEPFPPTTGGAGISTVDTRLIIKTGTFSLVAGNVSEAASTITRIAEENKGIVVSNQVYNMDTNPQATVVVRVPVQTFNDVVSKIKGVGVVQSESINGQDVTEEYVDLEAQLNNLRAAETQFLEIMKKAVQIQDILAVQRELTSVRAQIESLEGRMKYLSESADYSTITVYLSSDSASLPLLDESDEWKFMGEIKEALRSLIQFGKEIVSILVRIVIFAPVWIAAGLLGWFVVKKVRSTK